MYDQLMKTRDVEHREMYIRTQEAISAAKAEGSDTRILQHQLDELHKVYATPCN